MVDKAKADGKDKEPSEQEKALVKKWQERIKTAIDTDTGLDTRLTTSRKYQTGEMHTDGAKGLVRTNLIFATIAAMVPHIYAKDPDVSISPNKTVSDGQYDLVKKFGLTAEIVLDHSMVHDAKLKEQMKAAVRSTMVTAEGWVKMVFQEDIKRDPLVDRRIQDSQDNLRRVNALIEEIDEGDEEHLAEKAELEEQIKALEAQVEVSVYKGFVIDRIKTEDMLILDDSVTEFHMYPKAKAMAHRLWYTDEEFEEIFGDKAPEGASEFRQRALKPGEKDSATSITAKYRCVYEIWDLVSNTVYTAAEGANKWCRDPYQPKYVSSRFYPFFDLGFNVVEGRRRPMSTVELLQELQDEYNRTRTQYSEHREDSMPVRIARKGGQLTAEDIKRVQERKPREIIMIEGDGGRPLRDDMEEFTAVPLDPNVYDVSQIRNDMDLVSGMSDASRGNLIQPKTATEAEIMSQAMASRVDEHRDTVEDLLTEMFESALEISLEAFSAEEVKSIAGEDAVWPELDKEAIRAMVSLKIRGGSTSKPNKAKEREQWTQVMPIIKETMETVAKLRQAGQPDMANAAIELLKETLSRFDERIDVETFIPRDNGEQEQNAQAQVAQLTQQLQSTQEQLQQAQQQAQQLESAAKSTQKQEQLAQEKLIALQNEPEIEAAKQAEETNRANIKAEADKAIANAKSEADTTFRRFDTIVTAATAIVTAAMKEGDLDEEEAQALEHEMVGTIMNEVGEDGSYAQLPNLVTSMSKVANKPKRNKQSEQQDMHSQLVNTMMQGMGQMAQAHQQGLQQIAKTIGAPKRAIYDQQGNIIGSVPDYTLESTGEQAGDSAPESQTEDEGEING